MNKILVLAILCVSAGMVLAAMDDVEFTANDLVAGTTQTNSVVLRGKVERIELTAVSTEAASVSNTVVITSGADTILSKSYTNDITIYPRRQMDDYLGTALVVDGVNTNKLYDNFVVAGTVTVKQTAVGASATNDWKVKIVYEK